ncbi:MAG: trigger factor [Nitrospinae bacterium]|nr:trigger factor [Nitrospinota bacterium]
MKIDLVEVQPCVKRITVSVPADKVREEKASVISEIAVNAAIPGFRKGRAPRKMVEKMYDKAVAGDVARRIIDKAYKEALESNNLRPVGDPMVEDIRMDDNAPFSFTATVEVFPEITVNDISGIKLERRIHKVADTEIDKVVERLQDQHARMEPVEGRGVEDGDFAFIDYSATKDGQPVQHFNGANRQTNVSKDSMLEGFYDGLAGVKKGEEKEFPATLPKDFPDAELAGAQVLFKVKVHEIKKKTLPAADDELAREVTEFDTMEQWRVDIRKGLEKRYVEMANEALEEELLTKLIEANPFALPPRLLESQTHAMAHRAEERYKSYGMDMKEAGLDHDTLHEKMRGQAERVIKEQVILAAYEKASGVEVGEEEIRREVEKIAGMMGQPVEDTFRQLAQRDGLEGVGNKAFTTKVYGEMMKKLTIEDKFVEETDAK